MAVDSIRCSALGSAIIVEEAVKPSTEDEDIAGFGYVQSLSGGLVGVGRRIFPLQEGGGERPGEMGLVNSRDIRFVEDQGGGSRRQQG